MHSVSRLLALTVPLMALTAAATEYFLAPTGNDASPGTREQPWLSIGKANATLQPGDTATFLDGCYAGVVEPGASGTAAAPITYRAATSRAAVLTGAKASNGKDLCVYLKGRNHIVLSGFQFLPDRGGWFLWESSNHCVMRDSHMEKATGQWAPAHLQDCHYNRFEDLDVWRAISVSANGHVGGNMFQLFASSHNVVQNVHFSRAGHCPFCIWPDSHHNVVRGCTFDGRWGRNFELFTAPRTLFENCVVTNGYHGSGSADGRAKMFAWDSIVRRNIIFRNYYQPLVINAYKYQDMAPFGLIGTRLYNNTFCRNYEAGFDMSDLGDKPDPHMVRNNVLQNNLFADNDPDGDGVQLSMAGNIAIDNRFRANLFFGGKPGMATIRYAWPATAPEPVPRSALRTPAQADALLPDQFADNLDADPALADPAADDYRLRPGSPAIDAGRPLAAARDTGTGTELPVDDARWFYDGFGIPGEQGDLIVVGPARTPAIVIKADIETHVLTLDRALTWNHGDAVTLPHAGSAPDVGAYEHGAEAEPWYAAPRLRPDLRIPTMETATAPIVTADFEPENLEEWFYVWYLHRQKNTEARIDDTTAASGKRSLRVYATGDEANLGAFVRPAGWDIDRFPYATFACRIPPGVPIGFWLQAVRTETRGEAMVCVGGSPARACGKSPDLKKTEVPDDDQWHDVKIDVRAIREVYPEVKLLRTLYLFTRNNAKTGQQYWIDNLNVLPEPVPIPATVAPAP